MRVTVSRRSNAPTLPHLRHKAHKDADCRRKHSTSMCFHSRAKKVPNIAVPEAICHAITVNALGPLEEAHLQVRPAWILHRDDSKRIQGQIEFQKESHVGENLHMPHHGSEGGRPEVHLSCQVGEIAQVTFQSWKWLCSTMTSLPDSVV